MAVQIVGLNAVGYESSNAAMCEGRDLPWLQDVPEQDVWTLWGVAYRDVLVLDAEGLLVAVYNLTEHDLTVDRSELGDILTDAAP